MRQTVSVIFTVLNEAGTIEVLLDSLCQQTRSPDEVVVVDGGSGDGTYQKLEQFAKGAPFPVKVLSRPGSNISEGRNAAIASATGPLIASTDAGVRLEADWLAELVAPFEDSNAPDVVSGFFVPDPHSLFELVLGAVTLPRLEEIDPQTFHPSSRSVAFRRRAWQAMGGYPEWLDYCEDLLFDFALRDAGFTFTFNPNAVVHFRPRHTLKAFFRQYYRYARGDGKADFWRYRHALRYAFYLLACPLLVALALFVHPAWVLLLIGGLASTMYRPFWRLAPHLRKLPWGRRLRACAWVPLIRWTGDIAKMLGYPVGVWWRWHHAPKKVWPKRQI
ncbi:MAG: glycosyltransferase [Chloroflexota bacterium]|nr:glycosyltransferase [Chloroflexota bacterium]